MNRSDELRVCKLIARSGCSKIIDDKVVIEIKATESLHKDAPRQIVSYLRATNLEVGLLLHFGREAKFYRLICKDKNLHKA